MSLRLPKVSIWRIFKLKCQTNTVYNFKVKHPLITNHGKQIYDILKWTAINIERNWNQSANGTWAGSEGAGILLATINLKARKVYFPNYKVLPIACGKELILWEPYSFHLFLICRLMSSKELVGLLQQFNNAISSTVILVCIHNVGIHKKGVQHLSFLSAKL